MRRRGARWRPARHLTRKLPTGLWLASLRLEAGLCLYGSDIDGTTSPIEAGLRFTICEGP